jgi:hypothetical protein
VSESAPATVRRASTLHMSWLFNREKTNAQRLAPTATSSASG